MKIKRSAVICLKTFLGIFFACNNRRESCFSYFLGRSPRNDFEIRRSFIRRKSTKISLVIRTFAILYRESSEDYMRRISRSFVRIVSMTDTAFNYIVISKTITS